MNTVRQFFVDGASLSYLREALSLCAVDASVQRYLRLDAVAEFQRALELIADELFDTLVTDLDLPGGTGRDLVLTAIKWHQQMRSVLMTSYSCSAIRKRAGELLLLGYLEKPFDPDELVAALEED